jgi:Protein of unknown function (DUF2752)
MQITSSLFCSYVNAINWLQNNELACPFKKITGIDCPLCGLQRSIIALLQGDFVASFKYQPTTLLFIVALLLSVPDSRLNFSKKNVIKEAVYALTIMVVTGAYLYKVTSGRL